MNDIFVIREWIILLGFSKVSYCIEKRENRYNGNLLIFSIA